MSKHTLNGIRQWPAEKIAGRVLMTLIILSAILFALFYLIGFDTPFIDDANFNAPILTDVLLAYMYLLLAATIAVCVCSVWRGLKCRNKSENIVNGIPAGKITYGSAGLLIISLTVTFATSSAEPLKINGTDFTDTFWLKATDMLINTSILLIAVALCAVGYGLSGYNRHRKKS